MKSVNHSISDDEFEQLSKNSTCGHSGCDIASLARETAMRPVRELAATLQMSSSSDEMNSCKTQQMFDTDESTDGVPPLRAVTYEDFVQSLSVVTPSRGITTTEE